ncbi:hypothetical protein OTK49_28385 [Vibrio coralliirubri]|uniref:hypothetical protein n=1 Tax=Vibrio coralliirubri TaxID=1516159 RepID=UPI00228403C8|nr:hypothetical protein [Vibrio coralliirubri]MCY9866462.1 hypothetical protein [Vibrio coralliirubri]
MTNKSVIIYPLSFSEALDKVMNGEGWAQGERFKDGLIMMERGSSFMNGASYLHTHDFSATATESKAPIMINQSLISQRFRIITTQFEAMRK